MIKYLKKVTIILLICEIMVIFVLMITQYIILH